MTTNQHRQIQRLLKLAELTQEFEFVDLQLMNQFCELREMHGLAKLLLQIQEHVRTKTKTTEPVTPAHQDRHPNQNPNVVQ